MASTLLEATSSQHSSRRGRDAELAASEPQPAAPPLPLACELTCEGGPCTGDRVTTGALNFLHSLHPLGSPPTPNTNRHAGAHYTTANRGGAVLCAWGRSRRGRGHFSGFKYRSGCCETVGKCRLALHVCLDGKEPTRRNA